LESIGLLKAQLTFEPGSSDDFFEGGFGWRFPLGCGLAKVGSHGLATLSFLVAL
jgi:hypothetical protein